jgi:hypothetical protein
MSKQSRGKEPAPHVYPKGPKPSKPKGGRPLTKPGGNPKSSTSS